MQAHIDAIFNLKCQLSLRDTVLLPELPTQPLVLLAPTPAGSGVMWIGEARAHMDGEEGVDGGVGITANTKILGHLTTNGKKSAVTVKINK